MSLNASPGRSPGVTWIGTSGEPCGRRARSAGHHDCIAKFQDLDPAVVTDDLDVAAKAQSAAEHLIAHDRACRADSLGTGSRHVWQDHAVDVREDAAAFMQVEEESGHAG